MEELLTALLGNHDRPTNQPTGQQPTDGQTGSWITKKTPAFINNRKFIKHFQIQKNMVFKEDLPKKDMISEYVVLLLFSQVGRTNKKFLRLLERKKVKTISGFILPRVVVWPSISYLSN